MDFISLFKRGMILFVYSNYEWIIDFKPEELGDITNVYGCDMSNPYTKKCFQSGGSKDLKEVKIHKYTLRVHYNISQDETLLYHKDDGFWRWKPGTVITDRAIYTNGIPAIEWNTVEKVEYQDKDGGCFLFHLHDNRVFIIDFVMLFGFSYPISETGYHYLTKKDCEARAAFFTDLAKCACATSTIKPRQIDKKELKEEDINQKVLEEIRILKDANKSNEVIALLLKHSSASSFSVFDLMLSKEYLRQERYQEALNTLKRSASNLFPTQDYNSAALLSFDKGRAEFALGLLADARRDFLYASSLAKDARYEDQELGIEGFIRDLSIDYFNRVDDVYKSSFLSLPYFERKLLMVVKDYTDLSATHFSVFQIDHRPDISFPVGHPIANQLYVGHPYLPNVYIPFDTYELTLVEDRVREFCLLSQYLGATEISIEALNSSQSETTRETTSGTQGSGSYRVVSGNASASSRSSQRLLEAISKSISIHQEFTPYLSPTLPEGMVWYSSEPSWQRLFAQRMRGQDVHEERIETRKSQVVGGNELQEIKAELKTLVLSAKGEWTQHMEESFTQQENAILSIRVKFAPLSQLAGAHLGQELEPAGANDFLCSSDEQEYLDLYKEYSADGVISERDRKMLDKFRNRLGISEVRARELEANCSKPQLNEDEQEYLEMYKEYASEGDVSERDRKMLNKMRDRMGISEERAKEIEQL